MSFIYTPELAWKTTYSLLSRFLNIKNVVLVFHYYFPFGEDVVFYYCMMFLIMQLVKQIAKQYISLTIILNHVTVSFTVYAAKCIIIHSYHEINELRIILNQK